MTIPVEIEKASKNGVRYFNCRECEWELKVEGRDKHIKKHTGFPIYVFANNGYGDSLFLKYFEDEERSEGVAYEFFHEGSEIAVVDDDLDTLLGNIERPPSNDNYPRAVYESGEKAKFGDCVQFRTAFQFWRSWQNGVVDYVPGISKENRKYETEGLKWLVIKGADVEIGPLVDPKAGVVRKVRLINRANST